MNARIALMLAASAALHAAPDSFLDNSGSDTSAAGVRTFFVVDRPELQIKNGPLSVQARFRTSADGCIIECGAQNRSPGENQAGYAIYVTEGSVRFGVNNGAAGWITSRWDDIRSLQRVTDNRWHTVTGVFPGDGQGRVRLFLDGEEAEAEARYGQAQAGIAAYPDAAPVACIAKNTKPGNAAESGLWPGCLDEIRVWRGALSAAQVRASWPTVEPDEAPNLMALWDFGQAPHAHDALLQDAAGNIHGTAAVVTLPALLLAPFFPVDKGVFPNDDFRYDAYATAITGYNGQNLQRIWQLFHEPAVRTRVGARGNYKTGLTRLADGRLLLVLCRARRRENSSWHYLHVYESEDSGLSWTEVAATDLIGKEPSLLTLPDGAVLMTAQDADFSGGHQRRTIVARSEDAGRNWQVTRMPFGNYPRNVIIDADGSLLFLRPAANSNLQVCRSRDSGRTWEFADAPVAWIPAERNMFWETSVVRLDDGTLVAALRRQVPNTDGEGFEDTVITRSTDRGATWSAPQPLLATAEVHANLLKLRDGTLLVSYSSYHLPYGAYAQVSRDGGRTWDAEHPIRLSLSADIYVGWPVTIELPDASLITAYAGTTYMHQPPDRTTTEVVRWNRPFQGAGATQRVDPGTIAARQADLLRGYDLDRYPDAVTGYNGLDRQRVEFQTALAAERVRIGQRGDRWVSSALHPNGNLVAVVAEPFAPNAAAPGATAQLHESADGGRTWRPTGPAPGPGLRPSLTVLPDGALLLVTERPDPDSEFAHVVAARRGPDTSQWETFELNVTTAPANVVLDTAGVVLFAVPTTSGDLLLFRSADSGRTWTPTTGAVDWRQEAEQPILLQVSLARLGSGTLVAALQARNAGARIGAGVEYTLLTRSADAGETWSPPTRFLGPAQVDVQLLALAGDELLATFSNRQLPFGVRAVCSRDGGRRWSLQQPLQLARAAAHQSAWPITVRLADDRFLTAYTVTRYSMEAPRDRVCEVLNWELPR